jgi:type II secretory pathway component PulF
VAGKDILAITNQLGAAIRAGLPLLDALKIIAEQQNKAAPRELVEDLARSVSSGQSLSEAMGKYPNTFGPLYVSMVRVGETGGILDKTLGQLIAILQRNEKVKTSIRNASAYPIFVLCVGLISVIIVVTWILPRILGAISGGIAALPWPTRMLMAVSEFVKSYGLLVALAIAVAVFFAGRWIRGAGKIKWDSFKLRIPIIGQVLRTIAVGRFARTLGALTKGGVTILESLGVVRDTLGNEVLAGEIDEVAEKVKTGSSLAAPLGKKGFFPPLLVQIVSVGEQTGQLDELLLNAADTFDNEADAAIAKFMAVFPALLILLLALVIGFIIAATLLPIVIMELGAGAL